MKSDELEKITIKYNDLKLKIKSLFQKPEEAETNYNDLLLVKDTGHKDLFYFVKQGSFIQEYEKVLSVISFKKLQEILNMLEGK